MREIKGIVCVASLNAPKSIDTVVFGPNVNLPFPKSYQDFVSNGLTPFPDRVAAIPAYRELQTRTDLQSPLLAALEMRLQETEDELELFRRYRRFVVVLQYQGKPSEIFGLPHQDGQKVGHIGTTFFTSGMWPIKDFEQARYVAAQANRQGHGSGHLATWKFEYLPKPKI